MLTQAVFYPVVSRILTGGEIALTEGEMMRNSNVSIFVASLSYGHESLCTEELGGLEFLGKFPPLRGLDKTLLLYLSQQSKREH